MWIQIVSAEVGQKHWYQGHMGERFEVVETKGSDRDLVYTVLTSAFPAGRAYVLGADAIEVAGPWVDEE